MEEYTYYMEELESWKKRHTELSKLYEDTKKELQDTQNNYEKVKLEKK